MPNVNGDILVWAREQAGLSIESAARKLKITDTKKASASQKLQAYEDGEVVPSSSMLKKMSTVYRRPLLTFYLPSPPVIADKGEDFRTLPDDIEPEQRGLVDALIRDVSSRQGIVKAALIEEDEADTLRFIGSLETGFGISRAAIKIVKTIEFQREAFRNTRSYAEAFKYLRQLVEGLGVFVILKGDLGSHHSKIGVASFRGFALADEVAPFIVVNDNDSKAAWAFTLLHELAHLFLGQTGVSGAYIHQKIETFCSDVASEILLSSAEIRSMERFKGLTGEDLVSEINDCAAKFLVSRSLISYRLYRLGVYGQETWKELRDQFRTEWLANKEKQKSRRQASDGGPNHHTVNRYKLGSSLVNLVGRMNHSGTISTSKAGKVLGVRPLKVHNLLNAAGGV